MEIEVTNITAADNEVAKGINAAVTFIDYENNSGEIVVYVHSWVRKGQTRKKEARCVHKEKITLLKMAM